MNKYKIKKYKRIVNPDSIGQQAVYLFIIALVVMYISNVRCLKT